MSIEYKEMYGSLKILKSTMGTGDSKMRLCECTCSNLEYIKESLIESGEVTSCFECADG